MFTLRVDEKDLTTNIFPASSLLLLLTRQLQKIYTFDLCYAFHCIIQSETFCFDIVNGQQFFHTLFFSPSTLCSSVVIVSIGGVVVTCYRFVQARPFFTYLPIILVAFLLAQRRVQQIAVCGKNQKKYRYKFTNIIQSMNPLIFYLLVWGVQQGTSCSLIRISAK